MKAADLVDEVIYVPGAKSPFFTIQHGRRVVALNKAAVYSDDASLRVLKAAHELGHAMVHKAKTGGMSYAAEEVLSKAWRGARSPIDSRDSHLGSRFATRTTTAGLKSSRQFPFRHEAVTA